MTIIITLIKKRKKKKKIEAFNCSDIKKITISSITNQQVQTPEPGECSFGRVTYHRRYKRHLKIGSKFDPVGCY